MHGYSEAEWLAALTFDATCDRIKVSRSTLRRYVKEGRIHEIRKGSGRGRPYFLERCIHALERGETCPPDDQADVIIQVKRPPHVHRHGSQIPAPPAPAAPHRHTHRLKEPNKELREWFQGRTDGDGDDGQPAAD